MEKSARPLGRLGCVARSGPARGAESKGYRSRVRALVEGYAGDGPILRQGREPISHTLPPSPSKLQLHLAPAAIRKAIALCLAKTGRFPKSRKSYPKFLVSTYPFG